MSASLFQNKYIYAFGGSTTTLKKEIEKYDVDKNVWETIELSTNMAYSQVCKREFALAHQISSSGILIAGGKDDNGKQNDSYIFDTKT